MKKHLILTSLLAIVATTGVANAAVETTFSQVKSNLETEFKQAPDAGDYAVIAPNGDESDLSGVSASDYDNFSASTSADGDNVKINDTVSLNIAQGTVDVTDYQYKSFDAEGNDSYVSGNTIVTDLNKDYTLADGVTVVNVSTSTSEAPAVSLKTASDEPVYKNADGTFYLAKDAEGNIQLNGDANATLDNKASFDALMAIYNEDVENVSSLYTELTGYKNANKNNFDAVTTAKNADNEAIQSIVDNKATYTTQNTQYLADMSANTSYDGSVAQAIDNSIASAQTTTLNTAKKYADDLAGNYATADQGATADATAATIATYGDVVKHNVSEFATADQGATADATAAKIATYGDVVTHNVSEFATAAQGALADSALQSEDITTGSANGTIRVKDKDVAVFGLGSAAYADMNAFDLAGTAEAKAGAAEANANAYTDTVAAGLRADFATADINILNSANAYTHSKVKELEKDMSGGVAAATALSAVSVSGVNKGEVSVGGGYGYYNGQSAMAFGAAMGLSDRWSINAGAGLASGDSTQFSIRAGTNYKFKLF